MTVLLIVYKTYLALVNTLYAFYCIRSRHSEDLWCIYILHSDQVTEGINKKQQIKKDAQKRKEDDQHY